MSTTLSNETTVSKKLIDSVNEKKGATWISFEFFPPKTTDGVETLFQNIKKLKSYNPLFVDFTWGAGGSTSDLTMDLCTRALKESHLNPNMHLTCTGLDLKHLDDILDKCHASGIQNILALRGDPPQGQDSWVMPENGLTSALELIQHIKASKHGGYFCVGAACYPEGHPNKMTTITAEELPSLTATELARHSKFVEVDDKSNVTYKVCKDAEFTAELEYLKQKVDAGASFLVTQMFFDVNVFDTFVKACRAYGITVPIIPGIMLIGSYGGFKRMIKMCKTRVPESIERSVDALQSNDEGIKEYGIKLGVEMASLLLELGSPGLHFYTLNSAFQTSKILDELASLLPVLNVVA